MKRTIRLSESDLHRIVSESVKRIINEELTQQQYAHLAGQADGALSTFDGKVKGFFNPKWKQRKERQRREFANASTELGGTHIVPNSTRNVQNMFYNNPSDDGKNYDFYSHNFRSGGGENPYQIQRYQGIDNGDGTGTQGPKNGEIKSGEQLRADAQNRYGYLRDDSPNTYQDEMERVNDFTNDNYMLNRAYNNGRLTGRGQKGETGTKSAYFKNLGKTESIIREAVRKAIRESNVPSYEAPVCIDCASKEDAEFSVEIGYSDYASSLYYVGDAYDASDALEKVMRYAQENGFAELYAGDEESANEFPDDYYNVLGYPIRIDNFVIHEMN